MNAAETIAAAIEKLERERSRSTDGPWRINTRSPGAGTVGLGNSVGRQVAHYVADPDAFLIVTLHRTIDAQLEILRDSMLSESPAGAAHVARLARAILGEVA